MGRSITAQGVRVGDLIVGHERKRMKIASVVRGKRPGGDTLVDDPAYVMLRSDEPFYWWSLPAATPIELIRRTR